MNPDQGFVSRLLIVASIVLMVFIFYSPIWWVSLTAPNYPPEAFPDGVRIHFHLNGVFNGCEKVEKAEIFEDVALDCVHEMDTINHYVGMYPIAAGGVIEKAFAPFLMTLLGLMLAGFLIGKPLPRMIFLSLAFAGLAAWMGLAWYGEGGLKFQSKGYLAALVTAMDQDAGQDEDSSRMSSGQALIERLKEELGEYYVPPEGHQPRTDSETELSEKAVNIRHLKDSFDKDMQRKPAADRADWNGSSRQMLRWHYQKNLGRYFNNPEEIIPMAEKMALAAEVTFWLIILCMVLLVVGSRKSEGWLYWFLILVPIGLPLFFVVEYAAWLWWYGHNLNDMGAFTVKEFMPTVFGQGKVAQFSTHSYPTYGFMLMLLSSAMLAAAALMQRNRASGEE